MSTEENMFVYGSVSACTPLTASPAKIIKKNCCVDETQGSIISTRSDDRIGLEPNSGSSSNRLGLPIIGGNRHKVYEAPSDVESVCMHRNDAFNKSDQFDNKRCCWWTHPQVKSHWRVFLAAFCLLIVGATLIILGIIVILLPQIGFQSYVFFIAGIICFIPGAYHVVYVYCAVKGRKGYDFYQLPLFD